MRYGSGLLDEILRRTDLVQLVGRRVKLTRKGRVMWGCCPFHKEKSPSFKVENERRAYHCFGCGAGGDAFKWLQETEGLTFPESVERLAGEAGVELPKWSPDDEAREQQKKSLYDIVELACAFYEEQLRGAPGAEARDYLVSRGLDGAAAKQFRLGYAPSGNALIEHLKTKNVTFDDIVAAGLARPSGENRGPRDFFYNRLMFPITDVRGRVIAFGARALDPEAKPKYINTGETQLFSKGHLLYNYATARVAALKQGTILLAEGYMDVIALVRAGFAHAVAPLGTALTEDQLALMWRVAPEPVLAFDGDEAGLRAGNRAARLALPHLKPGHSLRFAFLPAGEDPDSLLKSQGLAAMQRLLDAAEPLGTVLWRSETEDKDFSTPERRAGLERTLRELVATIGDSTIADYYRRDFNDRVFNAFKRRAPAARGPRQPFTPRRPGRRGEGPPPLPGAEGTVSPAVKNSLLAQSGRSGAIRMKEMELMGLIFDHPEIAAAQGEILAALPFSDRVLDRFRHEILHLAASGFRLEKGGVETHLVRAGLASLVERLQGRGSARPETQEGALGGADGEDAEARWLGAAAQLRDMVELAPERKRALEHFNQEPSEESWLTARRLMGQSND